ncbi:MAG: hypothetical protein KDD47_10915 [Acidobacteria bacterium]|nr:hypothetical protein [Acidobacteriota bacterium]
MPSRPSLSSFRVNLPATGPTSQPLQEDSSAKERGGSRDARPYKTKAFELRPEAVQEFEILRAETGKKSYELAAEALNLLFAKYKKPQIA